MPNRQIRWPVCHSYNLILRFSCSEVRLNEALENACANVLEYKVHKDKVKALRYEKSMFPVCLWTDVIVGKKGKSRLSPWHTTLLAPTWGIEQR